MPSTKTRAEILELVKQAVEQVDPEARVILFGSRARGDAKEDSDWDFLILTPSELSVKEQQKYSYPIYGLNFELEQNFSVFFFSKSKWEAGASPSPLYDNIRREGIEL
ncbi:MAG: nucleotidyltransferase domain-containing protein [Bacteroidota bacterium]